MKKMFIISAVICLYSVSLYAQKMSKSSFFVNFTVAPFAAPPDKNVSYKTVISTPINALSAEEELNALPGIKDEGKRRAALEGAQKVKLDELRKKYLDLSGAKFIAVEDNADWIVGLKTSDIKVTFVNEKPINDLSLEDELFRYTYSAVITTQDKEGNILWEKTLVSPDQEQKMTKAAVFFNPGYRVKAQLYKNNPEKLKKLSDQILERKNQLVLMQILEMADKAIADNYEKQVKRYIVGIFSVKGKEFDELSSTSDKVFATNGKFHALSKKNRVSKEVMDQTMLEAAQVWEKYISRKAEMEDKAVQGLLLNCALAYAWRGDFEKAEGYLAQVPAAKRSSENPQDIEDSADAPAPPVGTTIILSQEAYATNMRDLLDALKEYASRVSYSQ